MKVSISRSEVRGKAAAPSSKSYTIRGLMCAALARGKSELRQPLYSDDTEAACRVLSQIGIQIDREPEIWQVKGGFLEVPGGDLYCGDSAATLRFMTAICGLIPGRCVLTAGQSLSKRPVGTLVEALRRWGMEATTRDGFPPVTIRRGNFEGGETELRGDISSQYVSALLLIAPLAKRPAAIRLTTPLESRSYVLMTLECLNHFGVKVKYSPDLKEYETIPQEYQPARYQVEGDWSSASYLLGLGATAGDIQVRNLNIQSLQGDRVIVDFLREMGASVTVSGDIVTVKKGRLNAIKADLNECIDLLPTMGVLAALAEGTSEFTGIQRARIKESNRVKSVTEGLMRSGIQVTEKADKITITGGKPQKATIDSQNDHRIAMAFSLMGAAAGGITIEGADCVTKTYPEYWGVIQELGVKTDEQ
jgi:3-phosphoshikimate 1-carboxyvinyltransferase